MHERKIITTADGSHTVEIPDLQVTYHSVHGAVQESLHVFINAGLHSIQQQLPAQPLHIFEMGFGTGLNAFLTALEAQKGTTPIYYTAIEAFPLTDNEIEALNYKTVLEEQTLFKKLHQCSWNEDVPLTEYFTLHKVAGSLLDYITNQQFNLVYYDAFAPTAQPELWTQSVFKKLYDMMAPGGALVTYCSKGDVQRAMLSAGFAVQKIPGPPRKREMLRATKPGPL